MRRIKQLVGLVGLVGISCAHASNVCQEQTGMLSCGAGEIANVSYRGFVNVAGTTVTNKIDILGNLNANNAHFSRVKIRGTSFLNQTEIRGESNFTGNVIIDHSQVSRLSKIVGTLKGVAATFSEDVSIVGAVDCDGCKFDGSTVIVGDVNIIKTMFSRPLVVNADKIVMSNSESDDITIKKPTKNKVQKIFLKSGSVVKSITFESGRGSVILDKTSKVLGRVQGGKISVS